MLTAAAAGARKATVIILIIADHRSQMVWARMRPEAGRSAELETGQSERFMLGAIGPVHRHDLTL